MRGGGITRVIIISLLATLACAGIIKAATTIGTNISTDGNLTTGGNNTFSGSTSLTGSLTTSGANNFYGATSIGGALTATSTLDVMGLATFSSNVGIGTTSPYAKLSVVGEIVGSYFTATSTAATSTFANGIYITNGCFRGADGSCISSGGGGSGTVNTGSAGYLSYYPSGGTTVDDTNALYWDNTNSRLGIGTTSPYAKLSIVGEAVASYFTATSTTATTTLSGGLNVGSGGLVYDFSSRKVMIGTTTSQERFQMVSNGTSRLTNTNYGNYPVFYGQRADGTPSAPTSIGGNEIITAFSGAGYDSTNGFYGDAGVSATMLFYSDTDAFTSTSHPSMILLETTPVNAINHMTRMRLRENGALNLRNAYTNGSYTNACPTSSPADYGTLCSKDGAAGATDAAIGILSESGSYYHFAKAEHITQNDYSGTAVAPTRSTNKWSFTKSLTNDTDDICNTGTDCFTLPIPTTYGWVTCMVIDGGDSVYAVYSVTNAGATAELQEVSAGSKASPTLGTADSLNIYDCGTNACVIVELGQGETVVCEMTYD